MSEACYPEKLTTNKANNTNGLESDQTAPAGYSTPFKT